MKTKLLFVLLLAILCSGMAFGQTPDKKRFSVSVSIRGDSMIESDLNSFLARELRSLGDVDVVDSGAITFELNLSRLKSRENEADRYMISYQFLEPVLCGNKVYRNFLTSGYFITDVPNVRKAAEAIVTFFDTTVLKEKRAGKL